MTSVRGLIVRHRLSDTEHRLDTTSTRARDSQSGSAGLTPPARTMLFAVQDNGLATGCAAAPEHSDDAWHSTRGHRDQWIGYGAKIPSEAEGGPARGPRAAGETAVRALMITPIRSHARVRPTTDDALLYLERTRCRTIVSRIAAIVMGSSSPALQPGEPAPYPDAAGEGLARRGEGVSRAALLFATLGREAYISAPSSPCPAENPRGSGGRSRRLCPFVSG